MNLELSIPKGWHELSQAQLRFLLETMSRVLKSHPQAGINAIDGADEIIVAQINTLCLFEWSGLKVVCPYGDGWLVRHGSNEFSLSTEQVAAATDALAWTKEIPQMPVRLDIIDGAVAVRSDLAEGFPFDKWLSCEALWQGYLATSNEDCLNRMASILYDSQSISPSAAELLGIFYWWASVKSLFSMMFPHFFQPATASKDSQTPTQNDIRHNMDAQIRALTKGDVTKEKEILALETIRALTELDAQAREYDEINKKYKKS